MFSILAILRISFIPYHVPVQLEDITIIYDSLWHGGTIRPDYDKVLLRLQSRGFRDFGKVV